MLSIVIGNLISNAVKYSTENGEIGISLHQENSKVSFSIADTGIGISKVDLEKIFNSFYRSDATNHTNIKGTGLGLSIVKRLCDLLKIEVSVTSEQNEGSEFKLSFSLAELK